MVTFPKVSKQTCIGDYYYCMYRVLMLLTFEIHSLWVGPTFTSLLFIYLRSHALLSLHTQLSLNHCHQIYLSYALLNEFNNLLYLEQFSCVISRPSWASSQIWSQLLLFMGKWLRIGGLGICFIFYLTSASNKFWFLISFYVAQSPIQVSTIAITRRNISPSIWLIEEDPGSAFPGP